MPRGSATTAVAAAMLAAFRLRLIALPLPQRLRLLGRLREAVDRRFLKLLPRAAGQFARRNIGRCVGTGRHRGQRGGNGDPLQGLDHGRSIAFRGVASQTTGTPISRTATPTSAPRPVYTRLAYSR